MEDVSYVQGEPNTVLEKKREEKKRIVVARHVLLAEILSSLE
jgi:hypothetical protein